MYQLSNEDMHDRIFIFCNEENDKFEMELDMDRCEALGMDCFMFYDDNESDGYIEYNVLKRCIDSRKNIILICTKECQNILK